jgi:hypothetical protein
MNDAAAAAPADEVAAAAAAEGSWALLSKLCSCCPSDLQGIERKLRCNASATEGQLQLRWLLQSFVGASH